MTDRLTTSATLSVLLMVLFVLFARVGGEANASSFEAAGRDGSAAFSGPFRLDDD